MAGQDPSYNPTGPHLQVFARMVGASGVAPAGTASDPMYVAFAQGAVTQAKITLVANTAQTILAANASYRGARILNWTASAVYLTDGGLAATPASGAPSDYIPAAAAGVPGQYEPPFAPVDGLRAVGASAGDLTVIIW